MTALTKEFPTETGSTRILDGVDLTLEAGETLALTGESGSGKSTLLHLIAGLETDYQGTIAFDGADLGGLDDRGRAEMRRTKLGIVFQQFNLIPSLDVAHNIAFQARLAGRDDPAFMASLADRLGLAPHLRKYPDELSGGQQQRVAIGRALAPRPRLVLADEPTGNLDEATSESVIGLMLELARETEAALMLVTHSTRIADRFARRLHLSRGRLG